MSQQGYFWNVPPTRSPSAPWWEMGDPAGVLVRSDGVILRTGAEGPYWLASRQSQQVNRHPSLDPPTIGALARYLDHTQPLPKPPPAAGQVWLWPSGRSVTVVDSDYGYPMGDDVLLKDSMASAAILVAGPGAPWAPTALPPASWWWKVVEPGQPLPLQKGSHAVVAARILTEARGNAEVEWALLERLLAKRYIGPWLHDPTDGTWFRAVPGGGRWSLKVTGFIGDVPQYSVIRPDGSTGLSVGLRVAMEQVDQLVLGRGFTPVGGVPEGAA